MSYMSHRLTVRRMRTAVDELTNPAVRQFAGLTVTRGGQGSYPGRGFYLHLVPVVHGAWIHEDAFLVYQSDDSAKTLQSTQAVMNFASRYGIDLTRVRFLEGCL